MSVILECRATSGRAVTLDPGNASGVRKIITMEPGAAPTSMSDADYEEACKSPVFRAWLKDGDIVNLTALGIAEFEEESEDGNGANGDADPMTLESITNDGIAAGLRDAGYDALDTLAIADVDDLTNIKGIGRKRATQLIEDAQAKVSP